jgi:hypothetical protein
MQNRARCRLDARPFAPSPLKRENPADAANVDGAIHANRPVATGQKGSFTYAGPKYASPD